MINIWGQEGCLMTDENGNETRCIWCCIAPIIQDQLTSGEKIDKDAFVSCVFLATTGDGCTVHENLGEICEGSHCRKMSPLIEMMKIQRHLSVFPKNVRRTYQIMSGKRLNELTQVSDTEKDMPLGWE